jgi:hypothetical protein
MRDELADYRHRAFGRVGDDGVPAIFKSFELDEMRRERGCDVRLAFDRMDRVVLAAEHEGRTLDAMKIGEHIEGVAFAPRLCEPPLDL